VTDLTIKQGSTFSRVLRWESPVVTYKPITAVTKSAPVRITVVSHGIPEGWRVNIQSVQGMKQLNKVYTPPKDSDYHRTTVVDPSNIELNDVNSLEYTSYTSGGVVAFNTPVDLTGYTARMQIKAKLTDTVNILSLTTDVNGGITIDNVAKTITLTITAVQTAALTFKTAVYSLEMVSSGGVVTELMSGKIAIEKEVTR
jgi:hypothetical protein